MKTDNPWHVVTAVVCLAALCVSGCATTAPRSMTSFDAIERSPGRDGHMFVRRARLEIEVDDLEPAADTARAIAEKSNGYVEASRQTTDASIFLRLRVSADELDRVLDELAQLGNEISRQVSQQDVIETIVDLEAMLKNKVALRDRLRELVQRAEDVKDVLSIEKELTRVQTEIDSAEARLKRLRAQVSLASIELTIEPKRILGPLGFLGKGIGWIISKLFVIR
ncbi:MAG: DUF4349 domain-containing protein [Lentisphaerae bacterium]|nr:DUF4349 domain-containing protein [Lentisphaerota bacterium]